ncbi:MAG: CvpA family protein [Candidatus Levybacteria bacterium]|nr:CvpA family protein [Candidatus Levybacteria bacterium]
MLSLNWIDYVILIILLFYVYEGYSSGFIAAIFDLGNFILSFLVGLRFYGIIAGVLVDKFSIPQGFSDAIGFFATTFLVEIIIGFLIRKFLIFNPPIFKRINKIFGIFPGILSGAVLISFILILIVAFPVPSFVKRAISSSQIGSFFLYKAQGVEKSLKPILGGAINETINFLTVRPGGNESVSLNFKTKNFSVDPSAEQYMFRLVNKERASRGLNELIFDNALRDVGRKHCEDMFERGYFSHYTPEGVSPFERMDNANINYLAAGENLALSPNTDLAMQGLMNSPGHKANILSTDFGKLGVGVIDGGIYGEMFCQEFTN